MASDTDLELRKRIEKDLMIFKSNLAVVERAPARTKQLDRVVELSKMYHSDCESYLKRGDLPTAFSCISYAHGLLDAVFVVMNIERYK